MLLLLLLLPLSLNAHEFSLKRKRTECEYEAASYKKARFSVNAYGEISLEYDQLPESALLGNKEKASQVRAIYKSEVSIECQDLIDGLDKAFTRFVTKKKYLKPGHRLEASVYYFFKKYKHEIAAQPTLKDHVYWNFVNHLIPVNDFTDDSKPIIRKALLKIVSPCDIANKRDNNARTALSLFIESKNIFLKDLFLKIQEQKEAQLDTMIKENRTEEV
ncbi:hypothetical protein Noda2021_09800 [Candidatus Dependentiae bacterium Noda2021]|nr:hypothetical protein Noda2021_09800 [Candidatus Dependentiae bacterium Noda2021]